MRGQEHCQCRWTAFSTLCDSIFCGPSMLPVWPATLSVWSKVFPVRSGMLPVQTLLFRDSGFYENISNVTLMVSRLQITWIFGTMDFDPSRIKLSQNILRTHQTSLRQLGNHAHSLTDENSDPLYTYSFPCKQRIHSKLISTSLSFHYCPFMFYWFIPNLYPLVEFYILHWYFANWT